HARVGHLPVVAVPLRLAGERDALAVVVAVRDARLVEPRAFETVLVVVADDNAHNAAAGGQVARIHLDDRALDRLRLAGRQRRDRAQVAEVFVAAREVEEPLAGSGQAEACEQLAAVRRDAGQLLQGRREGVLIHGRNTPFLMTFTPALSMTGRRRRGKGSRAGGAGTLEQGGWTPL